MDLWEQINLSETPEKPARRHTLLCCLPCYYGVLLNRNDRMLITFTSIYKIRSSCLLCVFKVYFSMDSTVKISQNVYKVTKTHVCIQKKFLPCEELKCLNAWQAACPSASTGTRKQESYDKFYLRRCSLTDSRTVNLACPQCCDREETKRMGSKQTRKPVQHL